MDILNIVAALIGCWFLHIEDEIVLYSLAAFSKRSSNFRERC
jgi:hypothetical protein